MGKDFDYKLPGMRKAQNWTVYPRTEGKPVKVQSDRSIGLFDPKTGEGVLNTKGCYQPHLMTAPRFTFPEEFVKLCLDNEFEHGQVLSGVCTIL
jgi:hypothetical protein